MEKETTELYRELISEKDIHLFTESNQSHFIEEPLTEYLNVLLDKYQIKKADVIRNSGLSTVYGYQIFDGRREPSRDKLIQLAIGFSLDLEETKKLLHSGGYGHFYPRNKRDALFIYAINNGMGIEETEELLFKMGEVGLLEKNKI